MFIQTQSVHSTVDRGLLSVIEKKFEKLKRFFGQIVSVRITLRSEHSGRIKDKIAEVQLSIPGSILFVRETSKSFEASIDSAISNLRRQLGRYKQPIAA